MEVFNKLSPGRKAFAMLCILFVVITLFGVMTAHFAGKPIDWPAQLSEGFYYAAIGFAVYHLVTRNKQIREQKEADATQDAADDDASRS